MVAINRIRSLKNAGILADRSAKDAGPEFRRYNLIYGFNGSGKSTIGRLFASLKAGIADPELPERCSFELELDDGNVLAGPDNLKGLEETVCVFNTDFIDRNFQWAQGTAKAIFYIGKDQAAALVDLKAAEKSLPEKRTATAAAEQTVANKKETLATFKRVHARAVAARLHLVGRKYEANNLQADYDKLPYDKTALLTAEKLKNLEEMAARSSALPPIDRITVNGPAITEIARTTRICASASVGKVVLEELQTHTSMVPWVHTGFDYHARNRLMDCLLCGEPLTDERKEKLAGMFDDALTKFLNGLTEAKTTAGEFSRIYTDAVSKFSRSEFAADFRSGAGVALDNIRSLSSRIEVIITESQRVYAARQEAPTVSIESKVPSDEEITKLGTEIIQWNEAANTLIDRHNVAVAEFDKLQQAARESIRKHFLAEGQDEFMAASKAVTDAEATLVSIKGELTTLERRIQEIQDTVRQHGPAAEVINKLVHAYLGHGELTIATAETGYELHRSGKRVRGMPSEGEKTAIALCYFLSTLGSDNRRLKDLIVIVDDPVSSLDTRAMNYACALIRSSLREAAQVFVLTHNQHCMNEFKKEWKNAAKEKSKSNDRDPTATMLYLDAKVPAAGSPRASSLTTMSKLLREHDSEYHFLCQKILQFEASGTQHFEYAFLMPNIIRKVLEIFLAFKVPGNHGPKDKIAEMCKIHTNLDATRMIALERLAQVESHADNLDDLIAHSSMTIEESRDANAALLQLMATLDEHHTLAIRSQCSP